MSGRGSLGCIAVILWVLLGVLWSRAAAAETMLAGRDYLLLGTASDAQPPLRECSPQVLASLVDGIEIPAPAEGWPGTPQAVDVFNVFAGEVMVAQGDRQICGNMQDARSRDSRFRAGIGMVFVPEAGSLQPIRVAWSPPLKARWVPTVRLGAPSELQREDTARLLVRTACIAVVMALALSALMGFVTTRDRSFLIYTLFCILLIGWQAVLSGLNGYPEPWLPVGDHANQWLLILSAVSVSAVIVILWRLCGAAQVLGISRRWAHGLSWLTMLLAISTPWLSWSQLNWGAEALNAVMILVSVIGLLVAVVAVWRGDHDAFDGVAALLPLLVLAVADVTANDLLVEYRIEALQLSNTWFLMMSAYALNRRLGQLRRQRDELRQLADTDVLTGLPNRRAGLRQLEHYVRQARAEARPLSIGFLDIDLFKQINDHYGHEVGDDVLIAVARTLSGAIRNRDDVIRMGGEEFLVLLPGTPGKVALARLNQLREQVMQVAATLPHEGLRITASIGLAELGAVGDDVRGLLRRADNAMYSAKRAGRNCVYPAPPFNITS